MALLVWLPLRGDLRNLGLDKDYDIPSTSHVVWASEGKIGNKALYPTTTTSGVLTYSKTLSNAHSYTICAWVKTTELLNSSRYIIWTGSDSNYVGFGFKCSNSGNSIDGMVFGTSITLNTGLDQWHHIAMIVDYENLQFSAYLDGVFVLSKTYTQKTVADYGVNIGWLRPSYYPYKGYINDVRIYDHCLSPKEIKEISKGLVLHYKLDDIAFESTTNLCTCSTTYENINEGQEYTVSRWGGDDGTITYYRSGGYNNGPYKVYHKTATGTGGIFKKLGEDIHIISGKTYTMSIYVKASRNFTDTTHSFNINRNAATLYSSGNRYLTYNKNISFTTEWQRISRTFTATDADAGDYGEMSIVYNDEVEDYYVYYSCFQIEESSYATEYVNGSRNPKIIDNLFSYSNLEGHGSSWVLQSETFYGHPIYKNVVTSPDTGNNAGFRIHSSITHSLLSLVTKITISFYKRLNIVYGKNLGGYVQVTKSDDTTTNYAWSYNKSDWANDSNSIGVWDYITATVTIPIGCKLINLLYVYTDRAPSGDCDFTAILLELSGSATPITNLLSKYIILANNICLDYSGYNNNGTIAGYLNINSDTSRYNYSTVFNGINSCVIIPYKTVNPSGIFTVNLWFKKDTWGAKGYETLFGGPSGFEMDTRSNTSTTLMIYMASTRGGKRNLVTTMSLGNWYMITMTRDDEKERYYVNGVFQSEIDSLPMPNGNYFIGAWYNITRLNYLGLISDFRLYSTVLSEEDIKELYNTSAIIDNAKNNLAYLFNENGQTPNLLDLALRALTNKLWKDCLLNSSSLPKAVVTLTDNGLRVYREPNNTSTTSGSGEGKLSNWGGFVLTNANNMFGLLDGHTYLIQVDVKGKSDRALSDYGWRHHVGWNYTNTGIAPAPTNTVLLNPITSDFNTEEWLLLSYKFTISDSVYKVATTTYLYHTEGETYLAYYLFKFGWTYGTTGEIGTDVYFSNLRMFDITFISKEININKLGILNTFQLSENENVAFVDYYCGSTFNQLIEI